MVVAEEIDAAQVFEAEMMSRQKAMHEATARGDSPVQQFYNNAVVFVTGGSGFLGKQFIEKLFRATNISKMFVLLRSKKGKSIQERLKDMLEDPVFDMVRTQKSKFEEMIVPIEGDVAELRLGLSDKDWNTVSEQTEIIFHVAATTRFDECLRVSTMINVRGTREALILGKACKKLKSYVHVSTAYSFACENLINTEVLEEFYPSPIDPETLIRLAETVEDQRLNDMAPGLIKNWPNTYSFAKAVAEDAVRNLGRDLPLCIVRPAVVICAKSEPNPGWIDTTCVYGASGIVVGAGLGLMHAIYANEDVRISLIPVDYVNNTIITAGWETVQRRAAGDTSIKIYTVVSSRNPTRFADIKRTLTTVVKQNYVSPKSIAYSFAYYTKNPVLFWIWSWIFHLIPAHIIDGICLITGQQRKFVKLYKKMYNMSVALSYFTINEWKFIDKNTEKLYENLSSADKEIFDFDVNKLNWSEYIITWGIGLRKYVVKDGLTGSKPICTSCLIPTDKVTSKPKPYKKVTHCIFDMDGTILDSESMYHKIVKEVCANHKKKYTKEMESQVNGIWAANTDPAAIGSGDASIRGATDEQVCKYLVKEFDLNISPEQLEREIDDVSRVKLPQSPLKKGAERLLTHLHETGVPLALATNSTRRSVRLHAAVKPKIFNLFHHIVCASDPGIDRGKPQPDIYLMAANKFPGSPKPAKCLVFEDSNVGLDAAYAAGMQVVMTPAFRIPPEYARKATLILKSLLDFKPEHFGLPPYSDKPDYHKKRPKPS